MMKNAFYFNLKWIGQYTIIFYKQQGQASALKIAYIFKVFGAQSGLMFGY